MAYKTAVALEMAVKAAAKASPQETNRAIAGFYFHRLLCRVFSVPSPSFVLKGGLGMLARTPDARSTRDIDLSSPDCTAEGAVEELKRLAAIDLGDFVTFRFEDAEPILEDDGYRDGYKVTFVPLLGGRPMQKVSIDLVSDPIPYDVPDRLAPSDRLEVDGIPVYDYLVYPVADAVADKVSGVMEVRNGRPSSRVKDLVDLAVYLTKESFAMSDLTRRIKLEAALQGIDLAHGFAVPESWEGRGEARYRRLASQTGLPERLRDMHAARDLVASCIDPALSACDADDVVWDPAILSWRKPY